ncbi:MAG: hypothetical protein IJ172_05335 [Ruminococcus sp.]|nr:hypothetical protein [Ruminococcus sp.]
MKVKKVLLLLTAAITLTACSKPEPLVSGIDSSSISETQTSVQQTTVSQTTSADSAEKSDRLLPDLSNWAQVRTFPGVSINLFDMNDSVILPSTLIKGGRVEMQICYTFELNDNRFDGEDAWLYILAAVNGELCDFEIAGQKSTNGILSCTASLGIDHKQTLTISDCTLKSENNTVGVYMAVYSAQVGGCQQIAIARQFKSDTQKTQSKEILAPSRYEQYIKYTQDDKHELSLSHNFEFEKGEFDEHKMQTTVPKGTKLQFRYINSNPERTAALDADLLVIVLKNGKPIKLFSGEEKALLPLTQKDFSALIPIETLDSGGSQLFNICIFDLSDEIGGHASERLFYVQ